MLEVHISSAMGTAMRKNRMLRSGSEAASGDTAVAEEGGEGEEEEGDDDDDDEDDNEEDEEGKLSEESEGIANVEARRDG